MNKKILYTLAIAAVANLVDDVNATYSYTPSRWEPRCCLRTEVGGLPWCETGFDTKLMHHIILRIAKVDDWSPEFLDYLISEVDMDELNRPYMPRSLEQAVKIRKTKLGEESITSIKKEKYYKGSGEPWEPGCCLRAGITGSRPWSANGFEPLKLRHPRLRFARSDEWSPVFLDYLVDKIGLEKAKHLSMPLSLLEAAERHQAIRGERKK